MKNRIIHQIWMQGFNNLPDKYLPNINSITQNNPGWTIIRWDDKGIREALKKYSCEIGDTAYLDKYNAFTLLHQRVDFARYFILYVYGGVSVDTDAVAKKGFDTLPELQTKDFIVSKNSSGTFVNNATILVSQGNPLLKELLDSINPDCSNYNTDSTCIWNTTGPAMFNKFVNLHSDKITVLESSYFEPCSGYDPVCSKEEIPENTILDHQHDATWVNPAIKNVIFAFHFCKRNFAFLIILLLIVILIVLLLKGK